jgi:hypothetical protein
MQKPRAGWGHGATNQGATTMESWNQYLLTPAVTLLLFSFATACGDDDNDDGSTTDADSDADADSDSDADSDTDSDSDSDTDSDTENSMPPDLGMAGDFAILAKSGISTVPASAITGDLGVSPAAATFITGFELIMDVANEFSTSSQVTGRVYAADYAPPTPSNMTGAIGDMELAYTDAAGRAPDTTELGAGDIGGMTLVPGVYKWGTGLLIPTDVNLAGGAADVWIFQIAGDLTISSGARVLLAGGALPKNVFWQVAGLVDLGTTAHCAGIVLTRTSITLRTGASIDGRLLAQTAVDIDGSAVVEPAD